MFLGPSFIVRDLLSSWRKINIPWLEQVEVHRETTRNIRVTVMSFYMGCRVCTYIIILLIIIILILGDATII